MHSCNRLHWGTTAVLGGVADNGADDGGVRGRRRHGAPSGAVIHVRIEGPAAKIVQHSMHLWHIVSGGWGAAIPVLHACIVMRLMS